MAALEFRYNGPTLTPNANPFTLYQIIAAANTRAKLRAIQLIPQGSTGASVPLLFDAVTQTGAGALAADAANVVKEHPQAAETIQTTFLANTAPGAEPAGPVQQFKFSTHQQTGGAWWVPPKPIIIVGGQRLGFRNIGGVLVATALVFYMEE